MSILNVGHCLPTYTAQHPRRQHLHIRRRENMKSHILECCHRNQKSTNDKDTAAQSRDVVLGNCFGVNILEIKLMRYVAICEAGGRHTDTYRDDTASGWNCASCEDASCRCWCHWHPLRCDAAGSKYDRYSSDCDDPLSLSIVGDRHTRVISLTITPDHYHTVSEHVPL
jgi:hypothetical protein